MPERDHYIPGVPCWVDTSQPDPEASLDFYRGLFGWEFEDVMPPDSEGRYFIGRLHGGDVAAVGSLPPGGPPMATWTTYIAVANADETAAKVRVIIECKRDRGARGGDGSDSREIFGTIGVSGNVIDASWQALVDAYEYHLIQAEEAASVASQG